MHYRKSSTADIRLREEKERLECTFQPKIIDNPFVSEKTLRRFGEATPASAMLRKSKRSSSPTDRKGGPGLLAGMYTAAGGLRRGPPEKPGIPMFYFDPFSPPNFATGTYGAPQVVTQVLQPVMVAAPAPPPPPAASVASAAAPPATAKSDFKAPPLPPWLGRPGGPAKSAAAAPPKIVIQKKEKKEAAPEPSGWQAVLLELEKRANKRNGGGGEKKEEKRPEPPKPQPKPKRTLGKKKEFKDPVEELKYKFALKRGEIREDDDGDDGDDDAGAAPVAEAKPAPAKKAPDIAAMLAKAKAAPAAAPPAAAAAPAAAPSSSGGGGAKAVATAAKVPAPPPLPTAWPPVPSTVVVKGGAAAAPSAAATDAPPKKVSGALAGAAAALAAALAARNGGGGAAPPAAEQPAAPPAAAPPAATPTMVATGETTVVTLRPGEAPPPGVETRTVTLPGAKPLPDGYFVAASAPDVLVAPYEILAAGETTVSLILQLTAQLDPSAARPVTADEDDAVLVDQLSALPGDAQIATLSRRLTAADLPVPAGYVQAVQRMQRNAQQRAQQRQRDAALELRRYDATRATDAAAERGAVDASWSSAASAKAAQAAQRLYGAHTKAFQHATHGGGSDEHKGHDVGAARWFQSLRTASPAAAAAGAAPAAAAAAHAAGVNASLHLSQLQQTQRHLLSQAQAAGTQPKEPRLLTDDVVRRRREERAAQEAAQQRETAAQEAAQRRRRLDAQRATPQQRYESLTLKRRKTATLLQQALPPAVRADLAAKVAQLTREMDALAPLLAAAPPLASSSSSAATPSTRRSAPPPPLTSSAASVGSASTTSTLRSRARAAPRPPTASSAAYDGDADFYYADFPQMPLLSPVAQPPPAPRWDDDVGDYDDDADAALYYAPQTAQYAQSYAQPYAQPYSQPYVYAPPHAPPPFASPYAAFGPPLRPGDEDIFAFDRHS